MTNHAYSQKEEALWLFSDLLNCIARRGWYGAGPGGSSGNYFLYVSFNIHPEDADRVHQLLLDARQSYGGEIEWVVQRYQQNRFILCPIEIAKRGEEINNLGDAAQEFHAAQSELGYLVAIDLIRLSDEIYRLFIGQQKEVFSS